MEKLNTQRRQREQNNYIQKINSKTLYIQCAKQHYLYKFVKY